MTCSCILGYGWVVDVVVAIGVYKLIAIALSKLRVKVPSATPVLITGCDTGFGNMLAYQLDKQGIPVLAACLFPKSIEEFKSKASSSLVAFQMDVTKDQSVDDAYETVKKHCPGGLHAVVNNAGVLRGGSFELMPMSDWELQLNVNVLGMARTTRRFLPLLRKSKGRVVNIASIAGRFATGGTVAYNASKFAVEGLSDALRRELHMWGIQVVIIEPGIMKTPLWAVPMARDTMEKSWNGLTEEQRKLYGREYFEEGFKAATDMITNLAGNPQLVVDALEQAVTARFPCHRYVVGLDAKVLWIPISYLPSWLSDRLWRKIAPERLPAALRK